MHLASAPGPGHIHFLFADRAAAELQLTNDAQIKLKPNTPEQVHGRPMSGHSAPGIQVKPGVAEFFESGVDNIHRGETGRSRQITALPSDCLEPLDLVGPKEPLVP